MRLIVGLGLIFACVSARAGNRHEHFQGMFLYSDLLLVYAEVVSRSREAGYPDDGVPPHWSDIPIARLQDATRLAEIFGADRIEAVARSHGVTGPLRDLNRLLADRTPAEIARWISEANHGREGFEDVAHVLRSFVEFTSLTRQDRSAYRSMESVRTGILLALDQRLGPERFAWLWQTLAGASLFNAEYADQSLLDISFPREFFRHELFEATRAGTGAATRVYLSIPRSTLLTASDEELEKLLTTFREAREAEWAHGIDISGSLYEQDQQPPDALRRQAEARRDEVSQLRARVSALRSEIAAQRPTVVEELERELKDANQRIGKLAKEATQLESLASQESQDEVRYEERLRRVFAAVGEPLGRDQRAELRVHGHERARTGAFYRAFHRVLLDPATPRPALLRIGHVNRLDGRDIAKYASRPAGPRDGILFEASPVSNLELHDSHLPSLVRTLLVLAAHNMKTVLGADSGGILGPRRTRLPQMLALLRHHGLEPFILDAIARDTREADEFGCILLLRVYASPSLRPFPPPGRRFLDRAA